MKKNQWKKPYKVKKKKALLKNVYFRLFLLFAFLASGVFYLLCFSPFFQLKGVEVSGNQKVETKTIENFIRGKMSKKILFFKTSSVFLTSSKGINKLLLNAYPQIDDIFIKKEMPNKLTLSITERQPVAVISKGESYYYIDSKGIAFEKIPGQDQGKIKIQSYDFLEEISLGQIAVDPNRLSEILEIKEALNKDLGVLASEADITSEQRLNIKTSEGWQIYFNLKGDLNWQMTELKTVLENKIPAQKRGNLEYIDLRFDMIFVSPEGITEN